uniref:Uncharacterized protein n=1 Tax=Setaria italica TaxID=4555 RepID=K3Z1E3_SETIT
MNTRNKCCKDKCVVWMDGLLLMPVEGALVVISLVPMKFIMQCLKITLFKEVFPSGFPLMMFPLAWGNSSLPHSSATWFQYAWVVLS